MGKVSRLLREGVEALHLFSASSLGISSIQLFELYPFLIGWSSSKENVSLSSVNRSSKVTEPEERVIGTSGLEQGGQMWR